MKTGDLRNHLVGISVPEKLTKVDMFAVHSDKNSKEANHADRTQAVSNGPRSAIHEENNNSQRKSTSHGTEHIKKVKCLEPAHDLPPTCMAAHAVDELIEVVEVENNEVMGATGFERNTMNERRRFSYLPPPPPLPYEDEDVEEMGTEMRDSDANDEIIGFIVGIIAPVRRLLIGENAVLHVIQDSASLLGDGAILTVSLVMGGNLTKGLKESQADALVIAGIIAVRYILSPLLGIFIVKGAIHFSLVHGDLLYKFVLLLQFAVPPAMNISTISDKVVVRIVECGSSDAIFLQEI